MAADQEMTTAERLSSLMRHLAVERAHFATQMPGDVADLARQHPTLFAGLLLCVPTRLDPAPFESLSQRIMLVAGAAGLSSEVIARALPRLPGARANTLAGYDAPGWADVVADRPAEIVDALCRLLDRAPRATSLDVVPASGSHAGITYDVRGQGPALFLLPFFLAPSQWAPALDRLAQRFTVIVLGGAYLGGVAALEDRARTPTYRSMFSTLLDFMAVKPDDRVLDVGCGSGALDRLLARRRNGAGSIVASDLNPFLLREAASLAAAEGCDATIEFTEANAEKLPFEEQSFDAVFSVTVLEECDADRALAQMLRVLRPGGRAGVIVRSIDLRQHWNMDVPAALRERAEVPPQSVGARGVADASLYRRMRGAGFIDIASFPSLITLDRPQGPIWRYREDHVLSQLSTAETAEWARAKATALAQGTLFTAHAMHCAVGTRPPL